MLDKDLANFVIKQFYESRSRVTNSRLDLWIKSKSFDVNYSAETLEELVRLHVIIESKPILKESTHIMPEPIKKEIQYMPRKFESDWYGYFLDENNKETEAEKLHKFHTRENDKQIFVDYLQVKKERNAVIIIAAIELVLLLIQLLK